MTRLRSSRALVALAIASSLVAAACGDDSGSSGSTTAAGAATTAASSAATTAASSSATTASATGGKVDLDAAALAFLGAKAGKADASKATITIGYVNQEGGALAFPDATLGVDAAVTYLNEKAGGIGGHPVKLVKCLVQAEEDGQKCGTEMLNNKDVQLVVVGMLVFGAKSLYDTLGGQKPVFILNPVTGADFTYKDGFAFSGGVAAGYIGFGKFIGGDYLSPKPKSLAIITTNNPAGVDAINNLVVPTLKASGLTDVRIAQLSDTATGPEVVSAIQAAKTDTADVILVSLQTPGCIAAYDALQSLKITTPVVTTNLCYAKPVAEHLKGSFPEGWIFAGLGWNPYMEATSAEGSWALPLTVREAKGAAGSTLDPTGPAVYTFPGFMTVAKVLSLAGADSITPASVRTAMKGYTGPLAGTVGNAACGKNPAFPAVCGSAVGFQQYTKGAFVSVADGYNGKTLFAW